ncbi:MAG: DNA polymerase beta domain protein region [Methanosarcinales archeaon 56_1174]|uniref:nucleotidyltransferase domain-containing protein n=1 Tax=Methermicoccus shengliensis TaxID=660064 RepID=UPI0005B27DB3|nr:nucleotidyltransferase domain-containing protein [Methermicoccus shengliensis]KUK30282.1 MAG: DNA polymerase beta domain protein region [Methanosarcinales archeaon 56_1174]
MIKEKIKNAIDRVIKRSGFSLNSIIIFGSRARGDFNADSDYDILIILNEDLSIEDRRRLTVKISAELHKEMKFTAFDIIVKSLKKFEEEKDVVNTISNEAFLEGVKI